MATAAPDGTDRYLKSLGAPPPADTAAPKPSAPSSPSASTGDQTEHYLNAIGPPPATAEGGSAAPQPAPQHAGGPPVKWPGSGPGDVPQLPGVTAGTVVPHASPPPGRPGATGLTFDRNFNTQLAPAEEQRFQQWKAKYAPHDSGDDYDLRGAFKSGFTPDPQTGHWPDTFKKPNHPTFSNESKYAPYGNPGHWEGQQYVPAGSAATGGAQGPAAAPLEKPLSKGAPTVDDQRRMLGLTLGSDMVPLGPPTGTPPLRGRPVSYASTPQEDALHAADRAVDTLPSFVHQPGYHVAEGGPVAALQQKQRVATANLAQALPGLWHQWNSDAQAFKQRADAYAQYLQTNAGQLDAAAAARLEPVRRQLQADQAKLTARQQQLHSYDQRVAPLVRSGTPIHSGLLYPQELADAGRSSTASEFGRNLANTLPGRVVSGAAAFVPFVGMLKDVDPAALNRARAGLMLRGDYPPLPDPTARTPAGRQQQIDQKNALIPILQTLGAAVTDQGQFKPQGNLPTSTEGTQPMTRGQAIAALRKLTPWQRQILPVVKRQLAAEQQAYHLAQDPVMLAHTVGGLAALMGGSVAHGAVRSFIGQKLGGLLEEPVAALLTRQGPKVALSRIAAQGAAEIAGAASGGAAGSGLAAGASTLAGGGNLKQAASAVTEGAVTGAKVGALFGALGWGAAAGKSALTRSYTPDQSATIAARAERVAQQRGYPAEEVEGIRQRVQDIARAPAFMKYGLAQDLAERINFLEAKNVTPPEAPAAPAPEPRTPAPEPAAETPAPGPEPRITTSAGTSVSLRHMTPEAVRAVGTDAAERGDLGSASVADQWLKAHAAHEATAHGEVPLELRSQYMRDYYAPGNQPMAYARILRANAAKVKAEDPHLAGLMGEAADQYERDWRRNWATKTVPADPADPERPLAPPVQASPWRRMSPEQQASLSAYLQKSLLIQDISHSRQVLDPTRPPIQDVQDVGERVRSLDTLKAVADRDYARATREIDRLMQPPVAPEVPQAPLPPEPVKEQPLAALPPEPTTAPVQSAEPSQAPSLSPGGQAAPAAAPAAPVTTPSGAKIMPFAEEWARGSGKGKAVAKAPPPKPPEPHEMTRAEFGRQYGYGSGEELHVGMAAVAPTGSPGISLEAAGDQPVRHARPGGTPTGGVDSTLVYRDATGVARGTLEFVAPPGGGPASITGIYVDPAFRRQGIGTQLQTALEAAGYQPQALEKRALSHEGAALYHARAVRQALAEGKDVPADVKRDYVSVVADSPQWVQEHAGAAASQPLEHAVNDALVRAGLSETALPVAPHEHYLPSEDPATLSKKLQAADEILAAHEVSYLDTDGALHTIDGLEINHAKGEGLAAAAAGRPGPAGERAGAVAESHAGGGEAAEKPEAAGEAAVRGAGGGHPEAARTGAEPAAKRQRAARGAVGSATEVRAGEQKIQAKWAVVDIGDLTTSHTENLAETPGYPQELQPRDRSRLASREQIADLANRLDPELMAENPLAQHGAPIVFQSPASLSVPYMTGERLSRSEPTINSGSRTGSAKTAPIPAESPWVVESGNARTIALRQAYRTGGSAGAAYKAWLRNHAARFGIKPEAVEKIQQPVLVRERTTTLSPEERVRFTQAANARETAAMGAAEQAKVDASRLTPALLSSYDAGGELTAAGNRGFMRDFIGTLPASEHAGMRTADGGLSQEALTRARNALFHHAYGDTGALVRLAEATDDPSRNITAGMLRAAGFVGELRGKVARGGAHPLDISGDVAAAAGQVATLREQGVTVPHYLAQQTMFGEGLDDFQKGILESLEANKRSAKKIATQLAAYVDIALKAGDPSTGSLFAGIAPPTKAEVWQAAVRQTEGIAANEPGLFTEREGPAAESAAVGRRGPGAAPDRAASAESAGTGEKLAGRKGGQVGAPGDGEKGGGGQAALPPGVDWRQEPAPVTPSKFDVWVENHHGAAEPVVLRPHFATRLVHMFSRAFESLPETGDYSGLKELLLGHQTAKTRAKLTAEENTYAMVHDLDRLQHLELSKVFVGLDMAEDVARQRVRWAEAGNPPETFKADLPGGLVENDVRAAAARAQALMKQYPRLRDLIDRVRTEREPALNQFLNSHEKVFGQRPEFDREWYMHHQIVAYENGAAIGEGGAGKGALGKIGGTPGFQKARTMSLMDWNTHFAESEVAWQTRALQRAMELQIIDHLHEHHDITAAVRANEADLNSWEHRPEMDQAAKGGAVSESLINHLGKMAGHDILPDRLDGTFKPVIDALHEHVLRNAERQANGRAPLLPAPELEEGVRDYAEWLVKARPKGLKFKGKGIPEGYGRWDMGRFAFYNQGLSVPERMALSAAVKAAQEAGIPMPPVDGMPAGLPAQVPKGNLPAAQSAMEKLKAAGGQRSMILKHEVIKALKDAGFGEPDSAENFLMRGMRNLNNLWKLDKLYDIPHAASFLVKKLAVDTQAMVRYAPQAIARLEGGRVRSSLVGALKEIAAQYLGRVPGKDLRQFDALGGEAAGLLTQEGLGTAYRPLGAFMARTKAAAAPRPKVGGIVSSGRQAGSLASTLVRLPVAFLEKGDRYAVYRYYLDHYRAKGAFPNFGVSKPDQVMALLSDGNVEAAAFKISDDVVGAYRARTAGGRFLRKYVYPFWSIKEILVSRNVQSLRNAWNDPDIAIACGRQLIGEQQGWNQATQFSATRAWALGRWALGAAFSLFALEGINHLLYPEEDKKLRALLGSRPYLITGRADPKTGVIPYHGDLSELGETLNFALGYNRWGDLTDSVFSGRKSFGRAVYEATLANAWDQATAGMAPQYHLATELAGQRFTPEGLAPVRDRTEQLLDEMSLGWMYRMAKREPQRRGFWTKMATGSTVVDPQESTYWRAKDDIRDWHERIGHPGDLSISSPSDPARDALYWYKQSLRLGDLKGAAYWLHEFGLKALADIDPAKEPEQVSERLQRSLLKSDPMVDLKKGEVDPYLKQINREEGLRLRQAYLYYQHLLAPNAPVAPLMRLPLREFVPAVREMVESEVKARYRVPLDEQAVTKAYEAKGKAAAAPGTGVEDRPLTGTLR